MHRLSVPFLFWPNLCVPRYRETIMQSGFGELSGGVYGHSPSTNLEMSGMNPSAGDLNLIINSFHIDSRSEHTTKCAGICISAARDPASPGQLAAV